VANHDKRAFRCGSTQTADGRPCGHRVWAGQLTCPAGHVVGSSRAAATVFAPPGDPGPAQSWAQARDIKDPSAQRAIALYGEPEQQLALSRSAALDPAVLREMATSLAAAFQDDSDPPSERTRESVVLSALATHPNCPEDVAKALTQVPDAHVAICACLRLAVSGSRSAKRSAMATLSMLQSLDDTATEASEAHPDYARARQLDFEQRKEIARRICGFEQTRALRGQVAACMADLQAAPVGV